MSVRRRWITPIGKLPILERKENGAINGNWEAAVSPSEHDKTHNKFRKWSECAREGVIGLVYQLFTVPMGNDI